MSRFLVFGSWVKAALRKSGDLVGIYLRDLVRLERVLKFMKLVLMSFGYE